MAEKFIVDSPDVTYTKDYIEAEYPYQTTQVHEENGSIKVRHLFLTVVAGQMDCQQGEYCGAILDYVYTRFD